MMRSSLLAVGVWFAAACAVLAQDVAPAFVTHPASQQVLVGDRVTLTAQADGTAPFSYQWRKDGTFIGGATNASYQFGPVAIADAGMYDVIATNPFGTATSLPSFLTVTKRPQTISFSPPATVGAGSSTVLTATASSNLPVTYSLVSGAGSLVGNLLTGNGGTVIVRASQAGDGTFAPAEPVDRAITFVAGAVAPFITSPPADQSIIAGTTATWHIAAVGTPVPTYQWSKDGAPLAGATTTTLTVPAVTLGDAGRYTVTATNLLGTATAAATLTVRAAPVFTSPPAGTTVSAGSAVTLSAAVTGYPAPTLQWRKNGTAIAGATGTALQIPVATAADAARYDVIASNALGTVTSDAATLVVVVREFNGTYFGRFTDAGGAGGGEFALQVRGNRSGVLLGYDSAFPAGLVVPNLTVGFDGTFAQTITVGGRPATLRGSLNDITGEVTGQIPELSRTLSGRRTTVTAESTATAAAGFYQLAVIGSAADRGYLLLAADGRALLLSSNGSNAEGITGTLGSNGRLTLTTAAQAALDLGFNNGAVSGTLRTPAGTTATIGGAIDSVVGQERLVNLAVRANTSNAAPLITGFVVSGNGTRQVLIRAAGPALGLAPFNLPGTLGDPTIQVVRGSTTVAQNDEWGAPAANGTAVAAATTRAGAFPFRNGSTDAALVATLQPAAYSVVIGGGNGATLAEIYEVGDPAETPGARRLVNLSARGLVSPGNPLIAGFVIAGIAPQRVLLRGIGPTLAQAPFNVAGALPNPQLTLYRGATVVKTNDDWFRDPEAVSIRDAAARAGAFALGPQSVDAAVLLYLAPGAYTVQVSGPPNANAQNGTGLALVEVYESTQ